MSSARKVIRSGTHIVSQENRFSNFAHGLTAVHAQLLDLSESLGLLQTLRIHEDTFGALHQLARLQSFASVAKLLLQRAKLLEPSEGYFNRRNQLSFAKRLHDVAHHTGFTGAI